MGGHDFVTKTAYYNPEWHSLDQSPIVTWRNVEPEEGESVPSPETEAISAK